MKGGNMLLENQKIKITISKRNISIYKKIGYKNISIGDELFIDVKDLSKGSRQKVDVKCDYCGRIIKVVYNDYNDYKFDKYSCKYCRQIKTSEYSLKSRQQSLYKRALSFCNKKGYKLISDISSIKNSDSRVFYECPKHGIHEVKIYSLITGRKCIECSIEEQHKLLRKKPDDVYNDFQKYGGVLLNKEEYIGWNYKNLIVVCKECGEKFITSYCAFTNRQGQLCPKCASNISRGEYRIKSFLKENSIDFYMQYRFNDCRKHIPLPFDFFLPKQNLCIEYDGEGHYIPINRNYNNEKSAEDILNDIKDRDNIKTTYCCTNHIDLLIIPYWEFNNIENILKNKLFT
jgi:hypothetical protein